MSTKPVETVPSDFYKVVASSDLGLSPYSGHITTTTTNSPAPVSRYATVWENLTEPWAGVVADHTKSVLCPAVLISARHVVVEGECSVDEERNSYAVFSTYRVTIVKVTRLCVENTGCSITILTLTHPLPHSVGVLCHPVDYLSTLLGVTIEDRETTRQLILMAMENTKT